MKKKENIKKIGTNKKMESKKKTIEVETKEKRKGR